MGPFSASTRLDGYQSCWVNFVCVLSVRLNHIVSPREGHIQIPDTLCFPVQYMRIRLLVRKLQFGNADGAIQSGDDRPPVTLFGIDQFSDNHIQAEGIFIYLLAKRYRT